MKNHNYSNINAKLESITANTLVIGSDIAKEYNYARAQDWRRIEMTEKPLVYRNDAQGYALLIGWIENLKSKYGKTEVMFGVEPSGSYWKPLFEYLGRKNNIRLVMVNPFHVKLSKELEDNSPSKNDGKDSRLIAGMINDGKYCDMMVQEGLYAELRCLMQHRFTVAAQQAQVKCRINQWIEEYFPEMQDAIGKWTGKTGMAILKTMPLPVETIRHSVDEIVAKWREQGMKKISRKRAVKLQTAAKESVGISYGLTAAKMKLQNLIEQYEMYMKQLAGIMLQADLIMDELPESKLMLSIKGVGKIAVASFIAEVGNIRKYDSWEQISKLAGLNLVSMSSGQHRGCTVIAKRGRSMLRAALFRAVITLVAQNSEFKEMHQHFTKRTKNPLKKKQSIVALMNKLIRIIFGLVKNNRMYDGKKLQTDRSTMINQAA
ncbi:MAG: IS110 family transposase [Bacillota bacterium]